MDRSLKAALLSGLVFPGVGQLFLKRPLRALAFLAPALLAAIYFSSAVLEPVFAIANEITNGSMVLDPILIEQRIAQSHIDTGMLNLAALVMVAVWIASTVDAWRLGRTTAAT
ncbi:hypothetical protein [Massilia sp. TSP1-1-2]|uniref:hypothetical protein n=1 Tax=unclassified Massilia TaxID=2609279 RepID=UPI003CE85986